MEQKGGVIRQSLAQPVNRGASLLFRGCREMTKEAHGTFIVLLSHPFCLAEWGTNAEKNLYIGLLSQSVQHNRHHVVREQKACEAKLPYKDQKNN